MKKILIFVLLFCPTIAFASNVFQGFYAGGQFGYFNPHSNPANEVWHSWRGLAGYKFNKNFAVEAGYGSYINKDDKKLIGIDVSGYAVTVLKKPFSAFVKGGAMRMYKKINVNKTFRLMPLVGMGLAINPFRHLSADISWTHIIRIGPIDKVDFVALGLKFVL